MNEKKYYSLKMSDLCMVLYGIEGVSDPMSADESMQPTPITLMVPIVPLEIADGLAEILNAKDPEGKIAAQVQEFLDLRLAAAQPNFGEEGL